MPQRAASVPIEATFGFIDIAGFTALTEVQGDRDAAEVATRLADMARASLAPGDELIKTIGDAVLITTPSPAAAVTFVDRLLTAAAHVPRFPALRAGLHHGTAVRHADDVFGSAVNLAARVGAEAYAGEVLCTAPVAAAARAASIPVADLGAVLLKNVSEAIELYSLAFMLGVSDTPVDPVCHEPVDRRGAAGCLRYGGREYFFCSLTCAAAFASNPGWHAEGTE